MKCLQELCKVGFEQSMAFEGYTEEMRQREGTAGPREWGLDCQAKECGFCPGKRKEGLGDGRSREGEGNSCVDRAAAGDPEQS